MPPGTIDIPRHETLVEAVSKGIIDYIASNGLTAGDRLPSEPELVEMTGVSRLALREAVCILKGLGIVEAKHGKGVFVKQLDMASILGMLSPLLKTQPDIRSDHIGMARSALEGTIARVAAVNRDEEDLDLLGAELDGMHATLDDQPAFIEHDMAFHQELAKSTGNALFQVFMSCIMDLLREVQFKFPDDAAYRRRSLAYHQRVYDAVAAGDADAAASAMQEHIGHVTDSIGNTQPTATA